MNSSEKFEALQVVGRGSTQLLFETTFNIKPPMSRILGESYDVSITDYTVLNDRVLFKGNIEKTLYYNHPHANKQKNNQKDSSNNNEGNYKENNNASAESKSKKSFRFLSKSKNNSQKDENGNKENKSDNNTKNENSNASNDEFKCLNGCGQIVDSANGIVHFYHQVSEFSGTVEIPGVRPGDFCHVVLAEVTNCNPLTPKANQAENKNDDKDNTKNNLIYAGTQMFSLDIALVATKIGTSQTEKIVKQGKKWGSKVRMLPVAAK